jgi:hypothetical protein
MSWEKRYNRRDKRRTEVSAVWLAPDPLRWMWMDGWMDGWVEGRLNRLEGKEG